jgi:aryl-alcohol dehydrogenase-like predicted oxidoreductase
MIEPRRLGTTEIFVSPVALGCWPMAGMTRSGVTEADGLAVLEAALELGIQFLDTAYCYGQAGESERLIGRAIAGRRDEVVIATKCGLHWEPPRRQTHDARPERLQREIDESLRRLGTDHVELLYLHAPDPNTPLAESAGALAEIMQTGKARAIGVSNVGLEQLREFAAACPLAAFQPPYNMLQRGIEADTLPWCVEHGVSVVVYWPLMKGLLAGRLPRGRQFPTIDSRHKYPMFQGEEFRKNQDFVDALRPIAAELGRTVSQVVLNWTIHQPDITAALCGATVAEQLRENAGALGWKLSTEQLARIDRLIAERGAVETRMPV